jgi:hypothetical protein
MKDALQLLMSSTKKGESSKFKDEHKILVGNVVHHFKYWKLFLRQSKLKKNFLFATMRMSFMSMISYIVQMVFNSWNQYGFAALFVFSIICITQSIEICIFGEPNFSCSVMISSQCWWNACNFQMSIEIEYKPISF